jgi:GNAT superfamily N-acetyltransferase
MHDLGARLKTLRTIEAAPGSEAFAALCTLEPSVDASAFAAAASLFEGYGRSRHLLLFEGDEPVGRLTASVNPRVSSADGEQVGYLGAQVFREDPKYLRALLDPALAWLREQGCGLVRAPVTFHTWHPFRFVTEGFEHPQLPGEPQNPPHHAPFFEKEGFEPCAWYVSMETTELGEMIDAAREELERYEQGPLRVRSLDVSRPAEELASFHRLILASFERNVSYSSIDFDEFRNLYAGAAGGMDPRLVLVCEDTGPSPRTQDRLAGLMYCLAVRNETAQPTIVLKTLAVHPAYRGDGLGGALTALTHQKAVELGFTRAVHALMRTGRPPASVSSRAMRVYRRYILSERAL